MKTQLSRILVSFALLAGFAGLSQAQPLPVSGTSLTKTTLSAAITSSQTGIAVGATTGCPASGSFNAVSNPCVLIVGHEIMNVLGINGTFLTVERGAAGTVAEANPSGSLAFIGSTSAVKPQIDFGNQTPWSGFTFYGTPSTSVAAASITDVSGKLWYSAINIPVTTVLTKACILKGAGTMTDSVILALWDRNGNVLATTASTALSGSASIYQCIAFSNAVLVQGPNVYYVGVQGNGTTAGQFGMYAAGSAPDLYPTGVQTGGTAGTILNLTTPATSFNASQGPIMYVE